MKTLSATSARPFSSLFLVLLLFSVVLGACSSRDDESEPLSDDVVPLDVSVSSQSSVADLPLDSSPSREAEVAVITGGQGQVSAIEDVTNRVSIGATVVDGELSTYSPPPPQAVDGSVRNRDKITTLNLADGSVTNPKIADNAVTTPRNSEVIREDGISIADIAAPVDARTILNETIVAGEIAAGAVTTTEILNETIDDFDLRQAANGKIAADSLGLNKAKNDNEETQDLAPVVQQLPEPEPIYENGFRAVAGSPYSTFSIDVDNASYSNVRGYLSRGTLPPANAVRIEELVNYFDYNYPDPAGEHPFAFHSEVVNCPWNTDHLVVRLALQGKRIQPQQAAASNLVFLIDVSGSMSDENKLPLLKKSFLRFVDELRPQDRVAVVVYAGAAGLVLESTPGSDKKKIEEAIDRLQSGGSTAGGEGIKLAYKVARDNYLSGGINRVILATDGDFNVGVSSDQGLVSLIEEERKDGVFLSILGFGTGNYQDEKMEKLADNGNGNYYYIDREKEGERVLVDEMSGTLFAIAKDVKLQIKFNPAKVAAYRLIGYENRVLAAKDFDNDAKDAGELGAGHTVTALYEVVPVGSDVGFELDTTKGEEYQLDEKRPELLSANDLLLARLRYKQPTDSASRLIEHLVRDERVDAEKAQERTRFAMAVAEWGMVLRGSKYVGSGNYDHVLTLAKEAMKDDPKGYRREFVELVEKAKNLTGVGEAVGAR